MMRTLSSTIRHGPRGTEQTALVSVDWGTVGVVAAAFLGAAGATVAGTIAGKSAAASALAVEDKRQEGERRAADARAAEDHRRNLAELRRPVYEQLVEWSLRWGRWSDLTKPEMGFGIDPGPAPTDQEFMPWRARLAVVGSTAMVARFDEWEDALRKVGAAIGYANDLDKHPPAEQPDPDPWMQLREKRQELFLAYSALTAQAARDVQGPAYDESPHS
jgi:hypothetical protein